MTVHIQIWTQYLSATKIIEELSQPDVKSDRTQHTKARQGEVLREKWKNKVMHGQYKRNIDKQLISEEDTFLWISKGDLKAEIESEMEPHKTKRCKRNITQQKY